MREISEAKVATISRPGALQDLVERIAQARL
jgi:hypothetical protein